MISKLEKTGAVTVFIVWLLWLWRGPSLNFALLFAATLISIYYLWFGFFIFHRIQPFSLIQNHIRKEIAPFGITTSIMLGVLMSYGIIALLFGMFFYPGMQFMVGSSILLLVAFSAYITFYLLKTKRNKQLCRRYYLRIAILGVLLITLRMVSVEGRLSFFYRDYPGFVDAYLEYMGDPDNEQALERLRDERSRFR